MHEAPKATIDGVRAFGAVRLAAECDQIEDTEAMAANGWTSKVYMPGITTYTLHIDEQPVFVTNDKPVRTDIEHGVRFSWGGV